MSDERKKMWLLVLAKKPIFSKADGTTLYRVSAVDQKNNVVPNLRTFATTLPEEAYEFTLKKYIHPEHGTTWTILDPDPSGGPGKTNSDGNRLAEIEKRLKVVEDRLGIEPESPVHPAQRALGDEVRGPDFFQQ